MSGLRTELETYLAIRRAVGFKLHRAGLLLGDFVGYLEASRTDTITTENALAWAILPRNASSDWWAQRLSVVRAFARHLHAIDPAHEVQATGLLPARPHRATPYLYSDADIAALMSAARQLRSPLRATTFETLVGLLAVSGLRIGEALRLDRDDVDLAGGVLRIRESKFGNYAEQAIMPSGPALALSGTGAGQGVLGIIAATTTRGTRSAGLAAGSGPDVFPGGLVRARARSFNVMSAWM